jgi:hypothetical protein
MPRRDARRRGILLVQNLINWAGVRRAGQTWGHAVWEEASWKGLYLVCVPQRDQADRIEERRGQGIRLFPKQVAGPAGLLTAVQA